MIRRGCSAISIAFLARNERRVKMTTAKTYWLCQIAGWGAYSVAGVATTLGYSSPSMSMFVGYALFFVYSIGLTDWFRQQIKRRRWLEMPATQRIARLICGSFLIGTLLAALVIVVDYGFHREWWPYGNVFWLWLSTTNASLVWTFLYVQLTAR